jgi:uncharacterized protein YlxW (UPF0749 family)
MDLLNQIVRQPIDPDYALVAARGARRPRSRAAIAAVAVLAGALLAVTVLQTTRAAPVAETERAELIDRVQAAQAGTEQLQSRLTATSTEIDELRAAALGGGGAAQALEEQIRRLEPVVGVVPVTGPGLVIMVDDSPAAGTDRRDQVLDVDLQVLANGLWQAGAEAVAINGHRLSSLTAIRSAGDAITVDFRSLTRPYRVEAIGDPRTFAARFAETSASAWWHELAQNRRMRYEIGDARSLELAADPGLALRHAQAVGR